jgi:hypothetical protein
LHHVETLKETNERLRSEPGFPPSQDSHAEKRTLYLHSRSRSPPLVLPKRCLKIGRLDVDSGAFDEFPLPETNAMPIGITSGADGNLWFCAKKANKVGRITARAPA